MSTRSSALGLALAAVLAAPQLAGAQTAAPPSVITPAVQAETETLTESGSVQPDRFRERAPGFRHLFAGLGQDFNRLASKENVLIAGLGFSGAFGAHALDRRIAVSGWGRGSTSDVFEPGEIVGGALVQSSAAFATYMIGRAANKPRLARVGAELTRAQIVAQGVTQAIKFSTNRTRPDGTTLSFPSGHTAATFATATVLHREFGWRAGVPAYTVAAWVAASRVDAERHYLSDVIAGATVGILAGRAVTVGRGDARFAVAPMTAPGGIGVSFVLLK